MDLTPTERRRATWFTSAFLLITVVNDGFSGRPSPLTHQLLLLPFTVLFVYSSWKLLSLDEVSNAALSGWWTPQRSLSCMIGLELGCFLVLAYELKHFASIGYRFLPRLTAAVLIPAFGLMFLATFAKPLRWWMAATAGAAGYLAWMIVALASFPLTYLRSDMLPVILWADTNLLHHIDPYKTMYVADRIYDFPYLPGMIVAYLPVVWAHLDLRIGSIAYMLALVGIMLWAARADCRLAVAALVGTLLVSPYLQFRHELYLQPHWFWMVLSLVLMQRRHFAWAAAAFGLSMGIYQFSWIIFPFFILNAFWRRGFLEAAKLSLLAALSALAMDGPFLASAYKKVASNTVGQWNDLPRAMAFPMNFSYWATYAITPAHLQRLQAVLMVGIFAYCILRRRCTTTADSVRWMTAALGIVVMFNVIIDGYFFLTWLVLAMTYVCIANGWWWTPDTPAEITA